MKEHFRTCHLCEAMCGLKITTESDKVLSIKGDPDDVHSKGYLCPKGVALQDIHTDPNRLKYPVQRTAAGWKQISWEQAFDLIKTNIQKTRKQYGNDAVGVYTGNPTVHNTGTILYQFEFENALKTRNRFASHSLDQLPQMFVAYEMFGHHALFPIPDLERTAYFLILGGNPMVSNGSIMSTPNIGAKFKAIQAKGGKIVVVDPRRTRTADVADQHLFIRPGTDVYLLLAFVQQLFAKGLIRPSKVLKITDGIEALKDLVAEYTPEKISDIVGISVKNIEELVLNYANAPKAIIYGRLGVSTVKYGGLCHWLINCINILSGNLDVPGGVLFTKPAIDLLAALKKESKQLRWQSRVKGLPETGGSLPAVTMADEMLTPGEGQIRSMFTIAGNPVRSAPDSQKLQKAFEQLDFYVAIDIYINETTRHAHVILPPAAGLEVIHYDFALGIVAPRNIANFSPAVFPIENDRKYDWEILMALQERLEVGKPVLSSLKNSFMRWLHLERRIDLGLKLGPYGVWGGRFMRRDGISLKRLKAMPHGIDFGPMKPSLPKRLFTKNKRINLVPAVVIKELSKLEILPNPTKENELLLIGRRHLRSNNSWMHNFQRLMKDGEKRCTAILNPSDAASLDIRDGDWIRASTSTGAINIRATLSAEVMPGVVCIPHGWGHNDKFVQLDIAAQFVGANVNQLVSSEVYEAMTGNAVFTGIPVNISAVK